MFCIRVVMLAPLVLATSIACDRQSTKTPVAGGTNSSASRLSEPKQTATMSGEEVASVSLEKLLAGLPENDRPKAHDDHVRIERANKWLAENALGKRLEIICPVANVVVSADAKAAKKVVASLLLAKPTRDPTDPVLRIGGLQWGVHVSSPGFGDFGQHLVLAGLDEAKADQLRELAKARKKVSVRGVVKQIELGAPTTIVLYTRPGEREWRYLVVGLTDCRLGDLAE